MTKTDKTTIHDLAWEFIELGVSVDAGAVAFHLAASGVKIDAETVDYMVRRLRVEQAKRGQWGQVKL